MAVHYGMIVMQEAAQQEAEAVTVDIYLPNGNKQSVDVMSTDQTEDVLEVRERLV